MRFLPILGAATAVVIALSFAAAVLQKDVVHADYFDPDEHDDRDERYDVRVHARPLHY